MRECIILAGGFGTRLQSVVNDRPKCLAPVNGRPFLEYLLAYLEQEHIQHAVLSLGYKHEKVEEWLASYNGELKITTVVEQEPLGTGGGIRLALQETRADQVYVVNGDTLFRVGLEQMLHQHRQGDNKATLALKPMQDFDRYGSVTFEKGHITAFQEKRFCREGLINGGVYLLERDILADFPRKFSFEKEYLEVEAARNTIGGYVEDAYFIDIGIPEDYKRAQIDFREQFSL
ncbi:nucleotidyltransferase family protein [Microbacter margulisiae]|uniref:D-glycero-alpha-D-manno-heptose 1-phosphate guanylyltransferase n=1 Tax=Microbacter margulisiae TaxID=1350067 RepID=A0A7W5H3S4_9PORP|nr:nucleotidyltransferase family protein [Microbacter margulisiae]MBB3188751.1 D-glycero-alpha-D-manno-heptose 1-phosphate guanylyltransferase [Microbacter margulisiae]